MAIPSRNQLIISALCNRLKLEPKIFQGDSLQKDIKSLCADILIKVGIEATLENNGEVMKWMAFAENFPVNNDACLRSLNELNEYLASKSVLVGQGLTHSEADIIVFSAIYSSVNGLSDSHRENLPHLMRWMDYIQNNEDFGNTFIPILVEKTNFDFDFPASKIIQKVEVDSNVKKIEQGVKDLHIVEKGSHSSKTADAEKVRGDSQATVEKKKLPEKVADEKGKDVSVSLLKIQVGLIRKAWKHPSADSLLVEEIDTGDTKLRQVVSGLAKYCSPDELTNRRVVLIANVKPGKLRDVMSEGLVLCASNEDHSIVEPLIPPEGAKVGECVSFAGHEGKPEDVLNPKKKQLEKITPHLYTTEQGVATFKGVPFMTSGGPCTSSIPKASIK